ncbi:rhodanese-like domain-containing protein [Kitasatospora sp. NPDC093679]|uniref:rhodanese-like domain-containing protein n=1 Tax=Kitasatospora sp. NPDC093679 TaxID=3154983 RepID=UPI0034298F91
MFASPHPGAARETTPIAAYRDVCDGGAVLLDVREEDEFTAGHAPGAAPCPLGRLTAGGPLPPAAAGRTVLAICRSGKRSQHAVTVLAERGVAAVNVVGGMRAWAEAGLPVTTSEGRAGRVA